ncbi:MAG: copper resistance D family protein, partial [Candidatus Acidiferrales bacterium]
MLACPNNFADDDATSLLSAVLHRFSAMGMIAVTLIILSGAANTAFRIESPGALVTTAYGLTICFKILLLSIMITLAAINRFRLMPALHKSRPISESIRLALIRNVIGELVLGASVLVA